MSKKIVKLPIKWGRRNDGDYKIKGSYKLLVDLESNFIIDWYAEFEEFSINCSTTSSHEWNKSNNKNLILRKTLLSLLHIEHVFGGKNRKEVYTFNQNITPDKIQIINNFFKWHYNSTFQNIEYLISGNNATGRGSITTFINEKNIELSFFLQFRNVIDYDSAKSWQERKNNRFFWCRYEQITFENWILSNSVYFSSNNSILLKDILFHINDLSFKSFKELKIDTQCNELDRQRELESKISFKRNAVTNRYDNIDIKRELCYSRWQNHYHVDQDIQIAHIWPVNQIRKQCIENNYNWNFLDQIDDDNNILPLVPNVHIAFDHYKFYWKEDDGQIEFLDSRYSNDQEILNNYRQINLSENIGIRNYLRMYKNYLTSMHRING